MPFPFLLPLILALAGGGVGAATGKENGFLKGALIGGGLGLGATALPGLLGAGASTAGAGATGATATGAGLTGATEAGLTTPIAGGNLAALGSTTPTVTAPIAAKTGTSMADIIDMMKLGQTGIGMMQSQQPQTTTINRPQQQTSIPTTQTMPTQGGNESVYYRQLLERLKMLNLTGRV